ncbi:FitA-like ribbon-helix-helix domain-containing protein [Sphingomonas sp. PAMC 26617]|uniref:FitA-like ribbon-helix-helix domain-containing protein n=1 Tax=Sphingomonas sp. PAMC 26617 TaxID=1112216 RepID=UPI000289CE72|nr:hypothetical protein [Sphingomonas sp. PAMC 26617]
MATLTIRDLDDAVFERLKLRAAENHRSLEDEVAHMLSERSRSGAEIVRDLRASFQRRVAEHGLSPDSVGIVRALRDEA